MKGSLIIMSDYVYTDEERKHILYASSPQILEYKGKPCFCQNKLCKARMFVYNPENPEKAYFKSSGKIKHHKDCHTEAHHFSRNVYDEQLFSYPEALKMLEKPSTNSTSKKIGNEIKKEDTNNLKPLSTLNQIYTMCKNIHPNETYNGFFIRDILADTRTYDIYKSEINGYKIVECNFYRFEKNLIIMNYPCYPTQKEIHHISLYFNSNMLFQKFLPTVLKTKHSGIFAISGNWTSNTYIISSSKQIKLIQKEN